MARSRIVIEDGVIVAIDPGGRQRGEPRVVEGHGRWLLPGLWDTHIHHGFSAGAMTSADESDEQLLLNWRGYLRSGVTSVVSVGDDPHRMLTARAAERAGQLIGPRIFAAGSVLTAPGGHPVGTLMHDQVLDVGDLAVELDDVAAATRHVRTALTEHGLAVHRELELLVRAGLTPGRALTAATAVAAAKVGAADRLGTIEVGKEADLLLLHADPLSNVRNTRSIDLIVKRGQPYNPADLTVN